MPGARDAEAEVVVAVAWVVVVAIGGTDVPGVIVPRPATINPVRACSVIHRYRYSTTPQTNIQPFTARPGIKSPILRIFEQWSA